MSGSVEIRVNILELEKSEKKLAALSKSIAGRKVKVTFSSSKGAAADSIAAAAEQLNEIGTVLADLIKKTETAVTNTMISFTNTDGQIAKWFYGSEGVYEEEK